MTLEAVATAAPPLAAGVGVVGGDGPLAADDQLVVIHHADRHRRAPPDAGVARRAPDLGAGCSVVRGDERAAVLVLVDDEAIAVEQRRSGRSVVVADRTDLRMPQHAPVQVERHQTPPAERGVHALAVRDRRGGGRAVLAVHPLRRPRGHLGLPQQRPVAAAVGEHEQPAAAVAPRGEEDAVGPDDRRRVAAARNGRAPDDVLGGAPAVRVAGAVNESLPGRSAPAGPEVRSLSLDRDHADRRRAILAAAGRRCEQNGAGTEDGGKRQAAGTHGSTSIRCEMPGAAPVSARRGDSPQAC